MDALHTTKTFLSWDTDGTLFFHEASPARKSRRRARVLDSDLSYRFGFVALDRDAFPPASGAHDPPARLGWTRRRIGPVTLWTHPEAPLRVVAAGGARFVFLGEVIPEDDPAEGDPFAPERLGRALAGGDAALYDWLDGFAGRFALLLLEPGRARVFHDPMGARSVFYWGAGPFAVGSHARMLAECLGAPPDPAVRKVRGQPGFAHRKTRSLPGDLTLAAGVYALVPNNLFDSAGLRTTRYWPRAANAPRTIEDFHAALERALAALGRYASAQSRPVLGATAGADSRVVMAAFTRHGIGFETMTWTPELLTDSERAIIRDLVARLGVPHSEPPFTGPDQRLRRIMRANGGGYRQGCQSTFDMHAAFAGRPEALFIRGHGAEVMRGFFNLRDGTRLKAPTARQMARLFFAPQGKGHPKALDAMFEGFMRRANWDGLAGMGFDPDDIYYWEHRMGMWSATVSNEFDVAGRSLPAFNSRRLFAAAYGLPPEVRLTKRLFLDAAQRLEPRLDGLPLEKMVETRAARAAALGVPAERDKRWPAEAPGPLARLRRRLERRWRGLFPASPDPRPRD